MGGAGLVIIRCGRCLVRHGLSSCRFDQSPFPVLHLLTVWMLSVTDSSRGRKGDKMSASNGTAAEGRPDGRQAAAKATERNSVRVDVPVIGIVTLPPPEHL